MQMAAFNAVCPYEIGDKINAVKAVNGQLFSVGVSTITDIACTHYVKAGKSYLHTNWTTAGSMRRWLI